MIKKILKFIISRLHYANKADLIGDLLDGIQPEDLNKVLKVIDGRLNPKLGNDLSCNYETLSISPMLKGIPLIIQDNSIVKYNSFNIVFRDNEWQVSVVINGETLVIQEDDHTKIYILI